MPLVAEVKTMLDLLATLERVPIEQQTPVDARLTYKSFATLGAAVADMASVRDESVNDEVQVRVYTPHDATERLRPALVWFHGGGFVIGDLDTADPTARGLADQSAAVVVSVDYRRAPEHRCPVAAEDCVAALSWVAANAERLGVDRGRIAVGGDSAGGNLAAVTAVLARDRGGPPILAQVLVYPCLDPAMDTPSHRDNGEGYLLTRSAMRWFWDCYLGADVAPDDPLASPLHAADLSGLPPALIITAEYDPLRDEGEAYAKALDAAGVPVTLSRYDGEVHGFFGTSPAFGAPAAEALGEAAAALQKAFAISS